MVSSSEIIFQDDETPNSSWDSLRNVEFSEKSEEEKAYEKKERFLQDELFSLVDKRTNNLVRLSEEYSDIFHKANHPMAGRFDDAFDHLSGGLRGTGHATLETFFAYVGSKYPSPYNEEGRDPKKMEELETDFRRASLRQGQITDENLGEFVKIFASDGSQNDMYIANSLKHLGEGSYDFQTAFSNAVISYVDDPTSENRERMMRAESDHEGVLTNSIYNIAATFDESKTKLGPKLFEPTIELAINSVRSAEDIYDSVKKYLKFKIDNTADEYKPDLDVPTPYTPKPNNNPSILPDVILR